MKNQKTKKRNDNKYKVTKKRKYRKKIIGGWRKNKPAYYIDGWGVVPPPPTFLMQ